MDIFEHFQLLTRPVGNDTANATSNNDSPLFSHGSMETRTEVSRRFFEGREDLHARGSLFFNVPWATPQDPALERKPQEGSAPHPLGGGAKLKKIDFWRACGPELLKKGYCVFHPMALMNKKEEDWFLGLDEFEAPRRAAALEALVGVHQSMPMPGGVRCQSECEQSEDQQRDDRNRYFVRVNMGVTPLDSRYRAWEMGKSPENVPLGPGYYPRVWWRDGIILRT